MASTSPTLNVDKQKYLQALFMKQPFLINSPKDKKKKTDDNLFLLNAYYFDPLIKIGWFLLRAYCHMVIGALSLRCQKLLFLNGQ